MSSATMSASALTSAFGRVSLGDARARERIFVAPLAASPSSFAPRMRTPAPRAAAKPPRARRRSRSRWSRRSRQARRQGGRWNAGIRRASFSRDKITKGGSQMSFRATVVVGDGKGLVGVGCKRPRRCKSR